MGRTLDEHLGPVQGPLELPQLDLSPNTGAENFSKDLFISRSKVLKMIFKLSNSVLVIGVQICNAVH